MRILRRVVAVVVALVVGAVVVEGVFRVRDGGAFPHLNVYRPDDKLGVRLVPGSTEKISFSGNPITSVRINASGYRGEDWLPSKDELFVVGDSQAFGLGVEEDASFASKLGAALHLHVANGAVPTYGPAEYNAVLAEELPRRHPKIVVYTINLANDLFESAHPNLTRHAVWDGWAVRKENAPTSVTSFPGRALLFGKSHMVFALRGLLFKHGDPTEGAVASEGGWRDLVTAGKTKAEEEAKARAAAEADRKRREAKLTETVQEQRKLDAQLGEAIQKLVEGEDGTGPSTLRAARANPGDIVRVEYGEGSAPVPAIAKQIQLAAELRRQFEAKLRENKDAATLAALARRDALDGVAAQIRSEQVSSLRPNSPLRAHLERAKKLCDDNGAELVVLVLPLDVQVSDKEWAKYHAEPIDMSASRLLADDVLAMADELGARSVDAWPALAAAEPGAFLAGDLHMTPKGHEAVAHALEARMRTPARPARHLPPVPLGRSPVPTPDEWTSAPELDHERYENAATEIRKAGCRAEQVREWIRLRCKSGTTMRVQIAGRGEPLVVNTKEGSSFTVAMLEGDRFQLKIFGKQTLFLRNDWPLGEDRPWMSAYFNREAGPPPVPTADEEALCACHKRETGAKDCGELYGSADRCVATYAGDCRAELRCAHGDRATPPTCQNDEESSPVAARCLSSEPPMKQKRVAP